MAFNVESSSYRVLYVRYITVAALGAVFADWMNWLRAPKALLILLTALYQHILAVIYAGFSLAFIPNLWTNHHYPAAFYTADACALGTLVYSKISTPSGAFAPAISPKCRPCNLFWIRLQPLLKKRSCGNKQLWQIIIPDLPVSNDLLYSILGFSGLAPTLGLRLFCPSPFAYWLVCLLHI